MEEIQLARLCTTLAGMLIAGGAEIYRVEDTARRICSAYGHNEAQIYATPANFIITLRTVTGQPVTDSKSIPMRSTDLELVSGINRLSRMICARKPDAGEISDELVRLLRGKSYSRFMVYLSYFTVGASFTVFYGGSLTEAIFGGALALVVRFLEESLEKINAAMFLEALVCSMAVSLLAMCLYRLRAIPRFDKVIIGASMTMVPGVSMVNSMRDFISGDFFSGIYTLTEALLIAAGLAVGAGSAAAGAINF